MSKNNRFLTKLRKSDYLASVLYRAGVFQMVRRIERNVLTVLSYHRVGDSSIGSFSSYRPNISASASSFARQMDYVRENYNVISCTDVTAWLRGEMELMSNPAIITFDDGYQDNLSIAHPILFERGLPATIFLTTGFVGCNKPFYWDFVAYCFYQTKKTSVDLPIAGHAEWGDRVSRERILNRWINSVKKLPESDKHGAVSKLPEALDVSVPDDVFSGLYLTWDQVRAMTANGVEMGSHTSTHPILTRIPIYQVQNELIKSKEKIESEIGIPVVSFAYPNGQEGDFSPTVIKAVKEAGFEVAFTLLPGPTRLRSVRNDPLIIKRVFIGHSHSLPRFIANLTGFDVVSNMLSRFRDEIII